MQRTKTHPHTHQNSTLSDYHSPNSTIAHLAPSSPPPTAPLRSSSTLSHSTILSQGRPPNTAAAATSRMRSQDSAHVHSPHLFPDPCMSFTHLKDIKSLTHSLVHPASIKSFFTCHLFNTYQCNWPQLWVDSRAFAKR